MSYKVVGLQQTLQNLRQISFKADREIREVLGEATQDLKGKAQRRAPKKTGDLRGSASATVERDGNNYIGEVGFNEPYALEQHENLFFNHQDGEAKYLENPLNENSKKYLKDITEGGRRALGQ